MIELRHRPDGATECDGTSASSGLVEIAGRQGYLVTDLDQVDPFLVGMVSDGDRWAFLSSNGPLAAGRRNPDESLFPYETDDRLHQNVGVTGPVTYLSVSNSSGDDQIWWQPFDPARTGVQRSVVKSVVGDLVAFVDADEDSQLRFEWAWTTAEEYGFIRTATLTNTAPYPQVVDVLDGLVGVMPAGIPAVIYQKVSNLSNAYRRTELIDDGVPIAIYSIEAPVSDRADPEEVLRANVVWHTGLDGAEVSVDPKAPGVFRRKGDFGDVSGPLVTGRPGAYLLRKRIELQPGERVSWNIVADVALSHADIVALRIHLTGTDDLPASLTAAANQNHSNLGRLTAIADSQQLGSDGVVTAHHLSNVTYNILRGGVPVHGYLIDIADLVSFLEVRNRVVADRHRGWLTALGSSIGRDRLTTCVDDLDDPDLERLCLEYLPFSFSRRHGDPSRPWNRFDIRVRDDAGEPVIHFEGNWRDVFQNWEALCLSFPEYLPGVVALFANASTAEGYNAYRIGRDGIDWEVPDPADPWANIGYWGDHQVVYLLRLLRQCECLLPGALDPYLNKPIFTYADVPYRIADYEQMIADPRSTIGYDEHRAALIAQRVDDLGADGKLLPLRHGGLARVSLIEKLLVTALAKLSNFVPDAGIWMNTQRPEWNDANNALVGVGASMVTLIYLRDYLGLLADMVGRAAELAGNDELDLSTEVAAWYHAVDAALASDVENEMGGHARRAMMDTLGEAACTYRSTLWSDAMSGRTQPISARRLAAFCARSQQWLDATIGSNWRSDGLLHSYNQLAFDNGDVGVGRLPLMLEGQVAAIAAAPIGDQRRADLIDALFDSGLYRPDQNSFVLMAADPLPPFLSRNVIPDDTHNPLLAALDQSGDGFLVARDQRGDLRFHPDVVNSPALEERLRQLAARDGDWADLVLQHGAGVLDLFEAMFRHNAYLGRSGSMYAYEGIGSIYWHMVTKLLLAVQEAGREAVDRLGGDEPVVGRLVEGYRRVREGLGFRKSAATFGAIPIDPYSHTPAHTGAQQPGMTGAVKEELLARWAEVGIMVNGGELSFDAQFVDADELLSAPRTWSVDVGQPDAGRIVRGIDVPERSVAATVCQVPVVVTVDDAASPMVTVDFVDGSTRTLDGRRLDRETSREIFARSGRVSLVRAVVGS